ncbi:DUF4089 domain-containing protein [Ancylobacter sp. IITR112]|uniref:DUF4089 domain-containing protein n=1 Tax=Ancylobacter sp. IITR112 TaxID=3138073 RepID=UPI00352AD2D9
MQTATDDAPETPCAALLDAGLAVAGLPLEPELRPRVLMHLETATAMAALVTGFALPDEAEPAPVYRP